MFGLGGFEQTSFCGAGKEPAADEEQRTEGEETAVVEPCVVRAFADVVDREDLVIHDPFNEVEQAPADQQPPATGPAADSPSPVRGAPPENPDAAGDCDPSGRMEKAVPERIRLQSREPEGPQDLTARL